MGHARVDTTLNVYVQLVDGSLRRVADTVESESRRARFNSVTICAGVHAEREGTGRPALACVHGLGQSAQ